MFDDYDQGAHQSCRLGYTKRSRGNIGRTSMPDTDTVDP